ncbi:tetratricopeptide repeat protein [Streptomyces sp. NPDC047000]|uniref:tetratricopeptide repeat protein n=1 Tax=Streptomyces sp. NPDC047000 TaxID=3155474 RepID=UPI0033E4BDC4
MTRLSREKKRDQREQREHRRAVPPPVSAAAPIDVRVSAPGSSTGGGGTAVATIGGVPVSAGPGEEIQHTVLDHLHRIALATGRPVVAHVHDDRIGYVIPLQVGTDGASSFAGDPLRLPVPTAVPVPTAGERLRAPGDTGCDTPVRDDKPTHGLRRLPDPAAHEPVREAVPTFPLHAVPEPLPLGGTTPTFPLRAVTESAGSAESAAPVPDPAPGTVLPPTGVFGPPPEMDAPPTRLTGPERESRPGSAPAAVPARVPEFGLDPDLDPELRPAPARGFDAVAEAVLGDTPPAAPGEPPALLAEPVSRINEAVKAGLIDTAAELAGRTITEATGTLGTEHPEVLRLRELTAYIAYLAGEPVRSFRLSVELARIHRAAHDAEGAYGNVQSAATAWRAVRDPEQGLSLGRDLIGLWTDLAAEEGPAAEDIEELESARARMGRLTERVARGRGGAPARD